MDGFLKRLAQQVLAALRVGDQAVDAQHQVVGDQGVCGGEVAQAALDDASLILGQAVAALPGGHVGRHVDFLRHPVVGAAVDVLLPGPVVFERHQLVEVGAAVDHRFLVYRDPRCAHFQFFQPGCYIKGFHGTRRGRHVGRCGRCNGRGGRWRRSHGGHRCLFLRWRRWRRLGRCCSGVIVVGVVVVPAQHVLLSFCLVCCVGGDVARLTGRPRSPGHPASMRSVRPPVPPARSGRLRTPCSDCRC